MNDPFQIWRYQPVKSAGVLTQTKGLADKIMLRRGKLLGSDFPAGVFMVMDPDRPKNMVAGDNLQNTGMVVVVSQRLKDFLAARSIPQVEYLQIEVRDPKQNALPSPYFVVNAFDPVDCIDRSASTFDESDIIPGRIDSVEKLVVDFDRIAPERHLFRMKDFPRELVVSRELAMAITAQGFSGVEFVDVSMFSN